MDELFRIVDKRIARAENAVVRDYLAQHGLEGEEAEQAEERYHAARRAALPDPEEIRQLRRRTAEAETAARHATVDAEARVQLERLGVPERSHADVLLLAGKDLQRAYDGETGDADSVQLVREALEAVTARIPGLGSRAEAGISAGSRGNFPRQENAALVWQQQLDRARAAGDNAGAVRVINSAAERGIALR
ncbi:MAG: hypothetical protein E7559_09525 [Ruminococcaceae bacterium]|nr:hypothetical protein [Oscillospiraceae bacterium]